MPLLCPHSFMNSFLPFPVSRLESRISRQADEIEDLSVVSHEDRFLVPVIHAHTVHTVWIMKEKMMIRSIHTQAARDMIIASAGNISS